MLLLYQRQKKNYTVTVCFINTIRHNFTKERKTETLFYPEQRILLHTLQCELFDWLLLIWTLPFLSEIRDKMQVVLQGINMQLG